MQVYKLEKLAMLENQKTRAAKNSLLNLLLTLVVRIFVFFSQMYVLELKRRKNVTSFSNFFENLNPK